MTQQATPRPWHTGFRGSPDPATHFEGANGRPIGTTGGFQDSHHDTRKENEANAALIVQAVNAYDDMRAALLGMRERHTARAIAANYDGCICDDCLSAEAALAKATGGQP